ncbi:MULTISPECIES: shikimate dehydrogenase [unclassified Corynebacterium]|uniref:shikimate dehydrogenase n=1 Tax=unclassified Corynebacterium TaxID=2624378 RepID=UPI002650527E|nr:shikimate dehydrogenase [Corynebacterium sp.]
MDSSNDAPEVYSVEEFLELAARLQADSEGTEGTPAQLCAVLGRPVGHSLSPVIHLGSAAMMDNDALVYVRVDAGEPSEVRRLMQHSPECVRGFSVTMPGKSAAHDLADEVTDRAALIGSANTLVPLRDADDVPTGRWMADNTDVDGLAACLRAVLGEDEAPGSGRGSGRGVVVGNGGTSRPAVAALAAEGFTSVTVLARSERALNLQSLVESYGMEFDWLRLDDERLASTCAAADVLISTIPAAGAGAVAEQLASAAAVVDVIYDPYPTPLMLAARSAGHPVSDGLLMLAGQGVEQFRQFTAETPSTEGMYRLLRAHRRTLESAAGSDAGA